VYRFSVLLRVSTACPVIKALPRTHFIPAFLLYICLAFARLPSVGAV
jgi:uncharacterized membrane protein